MFVGIKRVLTVFFAALILASALCGCGGKKKSVSEVKPEETKPDVEASFGEINFDTQSNESDFGYTGQKGAPLVAMKIKDHGFIVIRLKPDIAKATVDHFVSLVKEGFYDGNFFTHSLSGHSLRAGDKTGEGKDVGEKILGEPFKDGVRNLAGSAGKSGAVSMYHADAADLDGATTQFVIMLGDDPSYNGVYCQFGEIIYGMKDLWQLNKDCYSDLEAEENFKIKQNVPIEKALVDMNGYTAE